MNNDTVESLTTVATNTVVRTINAALWRLGKRLTLYELVEHERNLEPPLLTDKAVDSYRVIPSSEEVITYVIENIWDVKYFSYHLRYLRNSCDGAIQYYYFEAIFSKPTRAYPIPQTTASVYFTVSASLVHGKSTPAMITFRLEGNCQEFNIREVKLVEEQIFDVLEMKRKLFMFVEELEIM